MIAFDIAKPVWIKGLQRERNITAGFRTVFINASKKIEIKIAASSLYRFFVNGVFVGHGPARGPHGFYRVDRWNITDKLAPGANVLAVEVVGYNVNSYYLLDQPAFLQTEIIGDNVVLSATGAESCGFEATLLTERVQKVHRYSYQRTFMEAYRLKPGYDLWRIDASAPFNKTECELTEPKALIPSRTSAPDFLKRQPLSIASRGTFDIREVSEEQADDVFSDDSVTENGPFKGFLKNQLELFIPDELKRVVNTQKSTLRENYEPELILNSKQHCFTTFDFGTNLTGFIGCKIICHSAAKLIFAFDEILKDNDIGYRNRYNNSLYFEMVAGTYDIESFEPYTLKGLKILTLQGKCEITGVYLREYTNPDTKEATFKSSSHELNTIFEAGIETFRQNAVDIFMDCPSRERAGWLCDSFFTARVEYDITGRSLIEKSFLENYLLPETFRFIPDGMLPMCYPSDNNSGQFIPNWAMWFVLELEEYYGRTGDREMIDAFKPRVLKLLDYLKFERREYGLLGDLSGWIFIEWSKANDFIRDINFPTNMLYAAALECAGKLYNIDTLVEEAEKIRDTIRKLSFNGKFFVDNAIREDGKIIVTDNITEVCQYYAFYFKVATPETYPDLWKLLVEKFGPNRKETGEFPEVHMANAFIGNYLRLELLSEKSLVKQLLKESTSFFLYMAERTGTLWENTNDFASCNHGFASHVVHCLYRDILGIHKVDTTNKKLSVRFCETGLSQCEGTIPTADGPVFMRWCQKDNHIEYLLKAPQDYKIEVTNMTNFDLIPLN